MQIMSVRVLEKWLSLMPAPFSMMHFHLYKEFCHYPPELCSCTEFLYLQTPPDPTTSPTCWKTNSQTFYFSSNELGWDKSDILPHPLLNDEISNHQVFQRVRKANCRAQEEPWSREGAKIPWCWAGGSHRGAPTSTIPGKTKNLELLCVFVIDKCSTKDLHIFSWRNFLSCQQEPPQTLWKQEMYCNAQKLVTFNQWEIQHSNTLNMEEQWKHSKKRSGMSESCTSSFPRIKKTEQMFCLFFYFIKKTHKNPLGPRVHLHFIIFKFTV